MGQDLIVPDIFKTQKPAQGFAHLNPQDENLAEGIGQSYGVIHYRGKTWSLQYRGDRHTIIRPDDGTPAGHLDVIILGQAKSKSKSFYPNWVEGEEGKRPMCASIDGVRPDRDVTSKQAETCALCPRNEWKSDPQTGRKKRECGDYKRLAVLVLPTQTKPIIGEPLMEPVFLRVPAASLNSLAIMGDTMARQGWHFSTYITRITFDPQAAHPQMVFKPLQGLTDAETPLINQMRADPTVNRIVGGEVTAAVTEQMTVLPPGTSDTGLIKIAPIAAPAPVAVAAPVAVSVTPITPTTPTTPTISDTGVPQESDAELDAHIARLLGK